MSKMINMLCNFANFLVKNHNKVQIFWEDYKTLAHLLHFFDITYKRQI